MSHLSHASPLLLKTDRLKVFTAVTQAATHMRLAERDRCFGPEGDRVYQLVYKNNVDSSCTVFLMCYSK